MYYHWDNIEIVTFNAKMKYYHLNVHLIVKALKLSTQSMVYNFTEEEIGLIHNPLRGWMLKCLKWRRDKVNFLSFKILSP